MTLSHCCAEGQRRNLLKFIAIGTNVKQTAAGLEPRGQYFFFSFSFCINLLKKLYVEGLQQGVQDLKGVHTGSGVRLCNFIWSI